MLNHAKLDKVVKQLLDAIPQGMRTLPKELEKQFHHILQSAFTKMDLVTKEEFNAQVKVLERTREKLEKLEKDLASLKKKSKASS